MKCLSLEATELMIGALRTDGFHADGTAEFINRMNGLFSLQEGDLEVTAPANRVDGSRTRAKVKSTPKRTGVVPFVPCGSTSLWGLPGMLQAPARQCKPASRMPIDVHMADTAHTPGRKAGWVATGMIESADCNWRAKKSFDDVMELRRSPSVIGDATLERTLGFIRNAFRTREVGQGENLGLAR